MLFRFDRERMFHTAIERCSWLQAVKKFAQKIEYEIENVDKSKQTKGNVAWWQWFDLDWIFFFFYQIEIKEQTSMCKIDRKFNWLCICLATGKFRMCDIYWLDQIF